MTSYTVMIDYREGENDSKEFTNKQDAIKFAKAECRWELTLYVTVIEENEDGETEIYSEEGSFA